MFFKSQIDSCLYFDEDDWIMVLLTRLIKLDQL